MTSCFHLEEMANDIAKVTFDLAGEKVNKFDESVMDELECLAKDLSNKNYRVLLFTSAKSGIFIAGADISRLTQINSVEEGKQLALKGQQVFNLWSKLPFPTVALINGACLGGGLEFALSCSYRIVTSNPKTMLGLPEVNLGILPGWGGTQRLPRLVGLESALKMIVSGKPVVGWKAFRMGLASQYISEEFCDVEIKNILEKILSKSYKPKKPKKKIRSWFLEKNFLGRSLLFRFASLDVEKKTKGFYPAPPKILEVLKETSSMNLAKGLEVEADAFAGLGSSMVAKNLCHLFFHQEALKKEIKKAKENLTSDFLDSMSKKEVGVLGAGIMGGGIAWLFIDKGLNVRLKDINWTAIAKGFGSAANIYKTLKKIRRRKTYQIENAMTRLGAGIDYQGFSKMDLVVEAIVEDMNIKKKVLAETESHVSNDCLLASNTSSLSINEMALDLKKPDRFIGMHFFNPVNRMPLVEVIPGKETSQETINKTLAIVGQMGKTPIIVQNGPGFLVNRILIPYMVEAVLLLEEGVDPILIDKVATDFGMPMGPLTLADEVGIDVCYKVAHIISKGLLGRYSVPEILNHMIDQQLLGKKLDKGFYLYKSKPKKVNRKFLEKEINVSVEMDPKLIKERLFYLMLNEASFCLEDKIIERANFLDMAMIMGTGFPPFRGGILAYADYIGLNSILESLKSKENLGSRFKPSALLEELVKSGKTFYESFK